MSVRARVAALWVITAALIAGGFAASWGAAVGAAERYFLFSTGPMVEPDIDWTSMFGAAASPLLVSGLIAVLVTLAVHAYLWGTRPREP